MRRKTIAHKGAIMAHDNFNINDFYNPRADLGSASGPLNLGNDAEPTANAQEASEPYTEPQDAADSTPKEEKKAEDKDSSTAENENEYSYNSAEGEASQSEGANDNSYSSSSGGYTYGSSSESGSSSGGYTYGTSSDTGYSYGNSSGGTGYSYGNGGTQNQHTPYPEIDPAALFASMNSKTERLISLGWITFILSIIGIIGAYAVAVYSAIRGGSILFPAVLFLILPVASVTVGVILLGKREKGIKNLIAGFLSFFLIFSICTASEEDFALGFTSEGAVEYIEATEELLALSFPEGEYSYYHYEDGDHYADICYDSSELSRVRAFVKSYQHFKADLPTALDGLVAGSYMHADAEAIFIYNMDTGEFNKAPAREGEYRMLAVSLTVYSNGESCITIYEETLNYTTEFKELNSSQNSGVGSDF